MPPFAQAKAPALSKGPALFFGCAGSGAALAQACVLMREPSVLSMAIGATDCISVAMVSACEFRTFFNSRACTSCTTFASFRARAVLTVLLTESKVAVS